MLLGRPSRINSLPDAVQNPHTSCCIETTTTKTTATLSVAVARAAREVEQVAHWTGTWARGVNGSKTRAAPGEGGPFLNHTEEPCPGPLGHHRPWFESPYYLFLTPFLPQLSRGTFKHTRQMFLHRCSSKILCGVILRGFV